MDINNDFENNSNKEDIKISKEGLESTHKTIINKEEVLSFLEKELTQSISDLEFISGGESSQAFSFEIKNEKYIIRVNNYSGNGFKKDQYAFLNFKSADLLIPEIFKIGQMDNGNYFAISEKVEGVTINKLPETEIDKINPNLIKILDKIHSIDISNKTGYGKWEAGIGNANNHSWKEAILEVDKYVKNQDNKPTLFETSFLEKDVWDKLYASLLNLIKYCPEERYLIHADFGSDNILCKDDKITGVIDWESSMYGDFMYDLAWLSFWSKGCDYEKLFREHYKSIDKNILNFEERILCYKLFIGLGSLSFYAYSGQKKKYESSKEKLLKLV